jgi:subfamily B ATP-binding cassette protein MsbA
MSTTITKPKKKRVNPKDAWSDARDLIWAHRFRLALGMLLMVISRLVGLVLPASSKYLT